ncbi:hypothetical protein Avbf_18977 [Armadillidium vulgare]|nr:hypothetical protein Avbf_18977 [Armadillidium vulgare]
MEILTKILEINGNIVFRDYIQRCDDFSLYKNSKLKTTKNANVIALFSNRNVKLDNDTTKWTAPVNAPTSEFASIKSFQLISGYK